jgi:tRNA pseudouridine38-40 synthase
MIDLQAIPQRIALGVEYDGSAFCGWQAQQPGVRTVQTSLEAALAQVANHPVTLHAAGRTDSGVHALEQVVHFDTTARRIERAWVFGTNVNLPPDVAVRWAQPIGATFHARFSAIARHYRYHIQTTTARSALQRERAVWVYGALDVARMRTAAAALVGEHDFSSFRAASCQAKSPIRRVHYLDIQAQPEQLTLHIGANGFLHHMVRNIAGVLLAIGRGQAEADWTTQLLALRDRKQGGITAPPQGLYFVRADYPAHFELTKQLALHHSCCI